MTTLTQANLDAQQKDVAHARELMRGTAAVANKAADELCTEGCAGSSYTVRTLAIKAERIAADINELIAMARITEIRRPDGSTITFRFGGKD